MKPQNKLLAFSTNISKDGIIIKKLSKKKIILILIIISVILAVCFTVSLILLKQKSNQISQIQSKISSNEQRLEEEKKAIKKYESEISEKDKLNSDIESELDEALKAKKKLEEENKELKNKITELKIPVTSASGQAVSPDGRRVCYLTFDDGPSPNTLKILDILKKYNIKATFFVINSPDIGYIKNMQNEGHTIGLHCNSHKYDCLYSSEQAYFSDLKKISDKVYSITGIRSSVIRFPGGSSNVVSKNYCPGLMSRLVNLVPQHGYSYFDWNVSSGDAEANTVSYSKILNNVLNQSKNKNSICVLMHDSTVKTTTVQALPPIIEGLSSMGYTFDSIKPETYGYHHTRLSN